MALAAPQMSGDQLPPADIENHTLVVIPVEWRQHFPNANTKAGEESPAIICNIVDLSAVGGVPTVYRGVVWWNVQLVNGLKRQLGQSVLGRMIKGQGQTGKNPPWILLDLLSNPAEKAWVDFAEGWLAGPEGVAFETSSQNEAAANQNQAQIANVTSGGAATPPPPPAAPPAPPVPAGPPAPPAGPPATYAPPAAPSAPTGAGAPPAPAAAPTPAPAGDLAAQLAGLPAEEVAKMLAALSNQGQAAH